MGCCDSFGLWCVVSSSFFAEVRPSLKMCSHILTSSLLSLFSDSSFPHGKDLPVMVAMTCSSLALISTAFLLDLLLFPFCVAAVGLVWACSCTTLSPAALTSAAVLCALVAVYCIRDAFEVMTLLSTDCAEFDNYQAELANGTLESYDDDDKVSQELDEAMEFLCDDQGLILVLALVSSMLWLGTALAVVKIPQPGNYATLMDMVISNASSYERVLGGCGRKFACWYVSSVSKQLVSLLVVI